MLGDKRSVTILGILSVAILFTFSATTSAYATPILNLANGHYYDLVQSGSITWTSANDLALLTVPTAPVPASFTGHLVTITDVSENTFVAGLSAGDFRSWIGLTDVGSEGTFHWVTDEPFVYSNWSAGEPNANGNYVEFFASNDKWNDITDSNIFTTSYVIEFEGTPTDKLFGLKKGISDLTEENVIKLLEINPSTGSYTIIGETGLFSAPSLAIDPSTGIIYAGGGAGDASIYTLHPTTGASTLVGDTGLGFAAVGGMDFDASGTLYASVNYVNAGGTGSDHLATINTSTGVATIIGPFGTCDELSAEPIFTSFPIDFLLQPTFAEVYGFCDLEGMEAIAFDSSGTLWGAKSVRGKEGVPGLYTIDTSTGTAAFVRALSPAPSGGIVSLDFRSDGTLYGGTARAIEDSDGGELVIIDPSTGATTFVGTSESSSSLTALSFEQGPVSTKITITKEIDNTEGGDLEVVNFPLFLDGSPVTSGDPNLVTPGDYTASETGDSNYEATFSGACNSEGDITVALGDDVTCTITNTFVPTKITITKVVDNTEGGDLTVVNFPLFLDESSVTSGEPNLVTPGSYFASEDGDPNYEASFSENCDGEAGITVALGDDVTCTITNTFVPTPPQAISSSANIDVISESDVGTEFTVTVGYDEVMDFTTTPTLRFELPLEPSTDPTTTTLTPTGGEWDCVESRGTCTSYTARYSVTDGNVEVSTVNLTTIPSARDLAGNLENSAFFVNIFGIDTLPPQVVSKAITGLHEITIVYHEPAYGNAFDYSQDIDPESPVIDGERRGIVGLSGVDECSPTNRSGGEGQACPTHVIEFTGAPANSDSTGSIVINGIPSETVEDEYGNIVPTHSIELQSPRISFTAQPKPAIQSYLLIEDESVTADTISATIFSNENPTIEVTLFRDEGAPEGNLFSILIQFTSPPPSPIPLTGGICDDGYVLDEDNLEECILDPDIVFLNLDTDGDIVTVEYREFTKEFTSSPTAVDPGNFGGQSTDPRDTIRFFESDAYFVGSTATLRITDATFIGGVIPDILIESSSGDTFTVDAIRIPDSDIFATGSVTLVSENPGNSPDVLVSDIGTEISSTYNGFTATAGVIDNPDVELLFAPDTTKVETCLAGDANNGIDTDFDGLCDNWEHPATNVALRIPTSQSGEFYELSCVDGATLATDPTGATVCPVVGIPDLYVELDYMERHEPEPTAVEDVVESFENGFVRSSNGAVVGVLTHIIVDNQVQHVDLLPFADITDDTAITFLTLKKANFGTESERDPGCDLDTQECIDEVERTLTAKRQVFRYGMFTHEQAGNVGSSGYAERPGNDFIVSLGSFDGFRGTVGQQSGTLMHEIGHTLALRHGGPDDINCKPNYPSVMNYLYQFDGADGGLLADRPLDFSRSAYTTIDEASLINGMKVISSTTRTMVIGGVDSNDDPLTPFEEDAGTSDTRSRRGTIAGTAEAITWAADTKNIRFFADVPGCDATNQFGLSNDSSFTGLRSQDDWGTIAFNFRVFDSFDSGAINNAGNETPVVAPSITVEQAIDELKVLVNDKLDGKDAKKLTKKLDKVISSLSPSVDPEKILQKLLKETNKLHDKEKISDDDHALLVIAIGSGNVDDINEALGMITINSKDLGKLTKEVDKLDGSPDTGKACKELDKFIKDVDKNKVLSSVEKTELKDAASAIKVLIPC